MTRVTVKTKNTYEAAYYMIKGGLFIEVSTRKVPMQRAKKVGYGYEWTITLEEVPERAIKSYKAGTALCLLVDLERERKRLKRHIKNALSK